MADDFYYIANSEKAQFAPFNNSTKITLLNINTLVVSTYAHFEN